MKWKLLDILILIIAVAIVIFSIFFTLKGHNSELSLYIRSEKGEWYYPLDKDKELSFEGPLGKTRIIIQNGSVSVESSPCEFKSCISHKPLVKGGDWNACLPNQIFISLEGIMESETDDQTF